MSKIWTGEERLLAQFFLNCGWKYIGRYIGKDVEKGDVRRGFVLYSCNPWKISEGSDFPLIYRVSDNFQTEIGRMSRNPHLFDKVRNVVNLNDIALDLPYANISTDAMNWIDDVLRVCGGDPDRDEMDISITADYVKSARFFNPDGELLCSVKVPAYVSNGLMMKVRYKIDSLRRKYERDQNDSQNS